MNAEEKMPGLIEAARASYESLLPGDHPITFERVEHDKMTAELAALKQEPALAEKLVLMIFPGTVPSDVTFYTPLLQFALYLDFTDQANEIVGIVWNQALSHLNDGQTEAVLLALPTVEDSLTHGLSALPYLTQHRRIPGATMLQLGEAIAKATANNFCGPGLDRTLETFAEKQPDEAMRLLSTVTPTENNLGILGIMLGRLRIGPHATSLATEIAQFEDKFRRGTGLFDRNVFYQSYYQEAFSSQLTVEEVEILCAMADANGLEDVHNLIVLLAIWMNHPRLNPPVFRRAYEWLEQRVSPTISDIGKARVAQLASFFNRQQYLWSDEWRPDIAHLVVAVLPIAAEHKGIWNSLEMYLVFTLAADGATFQRVVRELVHRSGKTWLKVLETPEGMTSLENQLKTTQQDDFIGELCLSSNRVQRHIGLYFFEELAVTALPTAALAACDPRICWILLYEILCRNLDKESTGHLLLSLLTQVDRMGEDFRVALKDELLVQAKNYAGACGEMFAKNAEGNPILQEVMAKQDKYFKALAETKKSPILQMQVPGYFAAMDEFNRRFANDIQRGAREHSVLMQIAHEVAILYERSWSTFQGNQLGDVAELQKVSHGMEIPRLEMIHPEGMQMRNLHALTQIRELEAEMEQKP
jgi:hypothetical protein